MMFEDIIANISPVQNKALIISIDEDFRKLFKNLFPTLYLIGRPDMLEKIRNPSQMGVAITKVDRFEELLDVVEYMNWTIAVIKARNMPVTNELKLTNFRIKEVHYLDGEAILLIRGNRGKPRIEYL